MVNTKFTIEKRDLFTVSKDYYLCHCISADFALGAGIAKKFAEMGVRDALKKQFSSLYEWDNVGECLCTCETGWRAEFNLITKERYFYKPTNKTLRQALCAMRNYCPPDAKIAMPKIGCGLDRLKWNDVEKIIKDVFADTDIEILVCDWR